MRKLFICLAAVAALACTISCDKNDSEEQIDDVTAIKKAVSLATTEIRIRVRGGGMFSGTGVFIDQGDGLQSIEKQKMCAAIYLSGANDIDPDKIESVEIFKKGIEASAISVAHEGFQMIAQNTALCMFSKAVVIEANSDIRPIAVESAHIDPAVVHMRFGVDLMALGDPDPYKVIMPYAEVANNMEPLKGHVLLTVEFATGGAEIIAKCIGQVEEIKADGPEGATRLKFDEVVDFAQVLSN